jgi:hypothetical protein
MPKINHLYFWLFIAVFSLGQLQRLQISEFIALYFHDILIVVWLLGWGTTNHTHFMKWLGEIKNFLGRHPLETTLIAWVGVGMLLSSWHTPDLVPWLYVLRPATYLIFVFSLRQTFQHLAREYQRGWLTLGLIMLTTGLMQYLWLPDVRFLTTLGWDDHYYRLIGTLFDPNFTGIVLVLTLIYLIFSDLTKKHQLGVFSISLVLLAGIALTFSRASYLALVLTLSGAWIYQSMPSFSKRISSMQRLSFPFLILFFIIMVWLAPKPGGEGVRLQRTASVQARAVASSDYLQAMSGTDLIFGQGLFSYSKEVVERQVPFNITQHARLPDNLFLLALMGTGLPGLGLLVLVLLQWLSKLAITQPPIFLLLSATLVHSQFNNTLFQPFVWLFLWGIISALTLNLQEKNVSDQQKFASGKK